MILTLYYMYATFVQWWRLADLRQKLAGTLNAHNALLLCTSSASIARADNGGGRVQRRSLENLLFQADGRIACTIVPRQTINLAEWATFPKDRKCFPVYYDKAMSFKTNLTKLNVLIQARLENVFNSQLDMIKMEKCGELVAWRAVEYFEVILRTDLERLTILLNTFRFHRMGMNCDLPLMKIELVDVDGTPTTLKYDRSVQRMHFSHNPIHFAQFTERLRSLYSKTNRNFKPTITIENGATNNKPVSEVKPTKKHASKNMLEVNHRPSSSSHKKSGKFKMEVKSTTIDDEAGTTMRKSYSDVVAAKSSNLQRQNATRSKPPNILVFADTSLARENVKNVLQSMVNRDKYTIYDMPTSSEVTWITCTSLVVVCGNVPATLTSQLISYLLAGGRLLCLCSDLVYSVLPPFSTAVEVREHELVRFTYGEWRRVKMMHHIFCYQASPVRKQFSHDSASGGTSPVAARTPSTVDVRHEGRTHSVQVQVLGAEETWQTPSLLLATVTSSAGKAVFSQVHLEVDPAQFQDDDAKYTALTESNRARVEILRHLLQTHLDIECAQPQNTAADIVYTPAYFLGRHDLKQQLLTSKCIQDGVLRLYNLEINFCTSDSAPPATAEHLPVLVHQCPTNFSTVAYFDALRTQKIGRLVIYADVLASTQRVLGAKLCDGVVVIARRQTAGRGRADNAWLSPPGCATFSLQLHVPVESHLGGALPLVQHLVMVAVVKALKRASRLDSLPIGLKWPNDLYAYGKVKLGGLICSTTIDSNVAVVNVGCGLNLANREPTICVNDLISDIPGGEVFTAEHFYAETFNELEELLNSTQENGLEVLFEEYYKYWLHTEAKIAIFTENRQKKEVTIKGVDHFGFLQVEDANGVMSSVEPDGNSFDMLQGLIVRKLSS